ncbi:MAG: hypothetical protein GXO78_13040 [Calditrichaeota bacterium]|nr:hypothetical protein [Calditrichota bacterium]
MIKQLNKKEKRLLLFLLLILLYAVFDVITNFDDYKRAYTGGEEETAVTEETDADTLAAQPETVERVRKLPYRPGVWEQDPFRSQPNVPVVIPVAGGKNGVVQPQISLRLQAISVGASGAVALINGMLVQEGDRIHGYRVVRIEPDRVILESGQQRRVLEMP